jgi:spore germination cell wall hydrolase CwlJ-like protein
MNAINEAAMVIMVSFMTQFSSDNRIQINPQELWCLSQNIYMEARAESYSGKQAVANVTRNRVKSEAHPDSYCAVVKEGPVRESWKTKKDPSIPQSERVYIPLKHRCQFSWWCDGEKDTIWVQYMNGTPIESNMNAWRDSVHIALDTVSNQLHDNTTGATYYYAHNIVYPHWAQVYEITEVIGNHTFMRPPTK